MKHSQLEILRRSFKYKNGTEGKKKHIKNYLLFSSVNMHLRSAGNANASFIPALQVFLQCDM